MSLRRRWTVRLEDDVLPVFAVRAPAGEPFGFFVPTCLGHSLAIRHATRCAELDDLKKARMAVNRVRQLCTDHASLDHSRGWMVSAGDVLQALEGVPS